MPASSGVVVSDDQKAASYELNTTLKISAGSPKPDLTLTGDMKSRKD